MRLLHTSDWHLGRTLHGLDLHDAQREVLTQICRLVTEPADGIGIDAVLIAGDIYDRAVPPVESVTLLAEVLAELTRHTTVIITGGNHDSAIRLGFGSLLFTDRLHVRTRLDTIGSPVRVGDLLIYPLPYLDPDHARIALSHADPLERSHQAVLEAAMARVRADLARRRRDESNTLRSVVMAHVFVCDGAASDSERPITIGGVDGVRASTFDGVDFVALGHLHGPQSPKQATKTVLHYSGSPLRYSFSERHHTKSVTLVDIDAEGAVSTAQIALTQPRPMADLAGELDRLVSDPALVEHTESWVRITVTDRSRPERMYERLRSRFPHLLQALHVPAGQLSVDSDSGYPTPIELAPAKLAAEFVRFVSRVEVNDGELALFARAFEQVTAAGAP